MQDNNINPDDNNEASGNNNGNFNKSDDNNDTRPGDQNIEKPEKESGQSSPIPPRKTRSGISDNRLSLLDKNNLRIQVSTNKSVKIVTVVRDKNTNEQVQSDEISLPQRNDLGTQEAVVLISISGTSIEEPNAITPSGEDSDRVRFIPKLIDENLQKILFDIGYGESVRIEYEFKDRKNSAEAKRHKNYLASNEKNRVYEIEVSVIVEDIPRQVESIKAKDEEGNINLIPNPEVAELIQPPIPFGEYSDAGSDLDELYKNPFDNLRKLIRKNTVIGIIAAVALHLAAAGFAYFEITQKTKEDVPEEPTRLIVIQDLPDPKIKLENVEDPTKPPPEEQVTVVEPPKRDVPRRVVQPPRVNRPKEDESATDTTEASALARELDSLRRLGDSLLAADSLAGDTSLAFFDIPDSVRNSFSEDDIGLGMYFPNNWKLVDEREINKNEKLFSGVMLTDTTAEKPGTMTIFIHLDRENKGFDSEDFTTEFQMLDTNLTAFSKTPETQAAHTKYEFYILNNIGTEKFSVKAEVRKEYFDAYKDQIEAVVRSINIKSKEDLEPKESEGDPDAEESAEG